jgi:hypothetical protein
MSSREAHLGPSTMVTSTIILSFPHRGTIHPSSHRINSPSTMLISMSMSPRTSTTSTTKMPMRYLLQPFTRTIQRTSLFPQQLDTPPMFIQSFRSSSHHIDFGGDYSPQASKINKNPNIYLIYIYVYLFLFIYLFLILV